MYWFIIKDTDESPGGEVHRARSGRVATTGALFVEFGGAASKQVDMFINPHCLGILL